MSLSEINWRLASLARDGWDRVCIPLKLYPDINRIPDHKTSLPGFSVTTISTGAWIDEKATLQEKTWLTALLQKADLLTTHHLSYFDLHDHDHGQPFNWHCDHAVGKQAPRCLASSIDYRDFQETGDCKLVWEPNRHHHLVVLGRAYRASGNQKYAEAIQAQLLSWLEANPYGYGMNWRSPLELAVRMINWVWSLDLIRDSGVVAGEFRDRIRHSVFLHLRDVTRKYSRGSSANNHLIGEAAGVFIACCYFPDLPGAATWKQQSFDILCQEILTQTTSEGCHRELALGYHVFVLQFFLFAGLAGRQSGLEFPSAYWQAVKRMLVFLSHLTEGGKPPLYGDCDDGYVLDLGNTPQDSASLLAVGAVLFSLPDCKSLAGDRLEPLCWLLGEEGLTAYDQLDTSVSNAQLASRSFPEAGLYLLQDGLQGSEKRISVLIDCGELGFKSIAAHGHADTLSFTLRAGGHDVLVDPGTYDYFTFPDWRNYFRSTRAHNTVEIDNKDQSVMLGPFLWGQRAAAHCLAWAPSSHGGRFKGEHDGYTRLDDPVLHRRTIELNGSDQTLIVIDEIAAKTKHHAKIFFHCAPACRVEENGPHRLRISVAENVLFLVFNPNVKVHLLCGNEQPIGGWVSPNYHGKEPATTIMAERECNGNYQFRTVISLTQKGFS
jgi:hypothetical protein